ncbi:MAG: hypothetical protein KDK40_04415 [Chlamydiia bacterium]|nr:hypothetical protein [Chlamydiia bacterium]
MSFERFDDSYDLLICLKRLRLTHKMKFHGHQILLNDDGDRMLLYEDQWTPLVELEPVLSLSAEDFKRHYTYTCRGIVAPSNSEAIHLFQQRSPRGEFSVEIVSRLMSPPHAWIRLISDEGEVYSAGFFPDRELQGWLEMVTALYPSRGRIMSPDPFEVIDPRNTTVVTAIQINREIFEQLHNRLTELQRDETLGYQLVNLGFGKNCVGLITQLFHEVGLECPWHTWIPFDNPYDLRAWQLGEKRGNNE